MKTSQTSIRKRIVLLLIFATAVLSISLICISYARYASTMDEHYKTLASNLAKTAATEIDGDKLANYLDNSSIVAQVGQEKWDEMYESKSDEYFELMAQNIDAYYDEMMGTLYQFRDNNDIKYIYIQYIVGEGEHSVDYVVDNSATYVIDADTEGCALGDWYPIAEENKQYTPHLEGGIPPFITNDEFGWLVTSCEPIYDSHGDIAAMMCIDISMDAVMADRHNYLIFVSLMVLIIAAIMILLMAYVINKTVVNPLNRLSGAAEGYVTSHQEGKESDLSKLKILRRDEIGILTESLQTMENNLNHYIKDLASVTAEKERIGTELNIATEIQASMLPREFPAFPDRSDFDVFATMTPAKEVGGDFYDFYLIDEDHIALTIADVSGKGVPAALFMAIAKAMIKAAVQDGASPKEALESVNVRLCEDNIGGLFVTVWLGILEFSTGKLTCVNAGHEFPVIRRKDGEYELFKDKHGFVVGGMDMARYKEYELEIHRGDRIFVYTDGVPEATDGNNELYGDKRMIASLNNHLDDDIQTLLKHVKEDVDTFVGEAPQFDDLTMLCFELK